MSDPASLLRHATALPIDGHDDEWLRFMDEVLKMPACYLPAAQMVLQQNRWSRFLGSGHNPIGYVKTATYQQALRMGLALDKYTAEPRVLTNDAPRGRRRPTKGEKRVPRWAKELRQTLNKAGLRPEVKVIWEAESAESAGRLILLEDGAKNAYVYGGNTVMDAVGELLKASKTGGEASPLFDVPDGLRFNVRDNRVGCVALPAPREGNVDEYIDERSQDVEDLWDGGEPVVPDWLQRAGADEAVDWQTVARHVVRKPTMVPAVTKVLELRAAGTSRPKAVALASNDREGCEIEAAWKWVDRERDQIARLFGLKEPPVENPTTQRATCNLGQGKRTTFIPAHQALKNTLGRRLPLAFPKAPALATPPNIPYAHSQSIPEELFPEGQFRFIDPIGLRGDVLAAWDGSTLLLEPDYPQHAFLFRGGTLEEALEALQEARNAGVTTGLFLGPAGKQYSRRPKVYLADPNEFNEFWENVPESPE